MINMSVAFGSVSPADAKAKLAEVCAQAKQENEGVVVVEAVEQHAAQLMSGIAPDHEVRVTIAVFVQVESGPAAGA